MQRLLNKLLLLRKNVRPANYFIKFVILYNNGALCAWNIQPYLGRRTSRPRIEEKIKIFFLFLSYMFYEGILLLRLFIYENIILFAITVLNLMI